MFRYDRPQAGRYRQFWQFDVEAIGDPGPAIDAEIIELATALLRGRRPGRRRGRSLNSIGDAACRPAYIGTLQAYFRAHEDDLPDLERARLATNPLRLLDSKDERMAPLIAGRADHHRAPLRRLPGPLRRRPVASRGARHRAAPGSHLVVAWTTTRARPSSSTARGAQGQQQALGGGGRYDGLVELLGGQPTPGIGFGIGLDRVAIALAEQGAGRGAEPWRPSVVVVGADHEDTVVAAAGGHRAARCRPGLLAGPHHGRLGKQLEGAARDRCPLRGHLWRRAGGRATSRSRTSRPVPSGRSSV